MHENNEKHLYLSDDNVVFDQISMKISDSSTTAEIINNIDNIELENLELNNSLLIKKYHELKTENLALKDREVLLSTELENMKNERYNIRKIKEEDEDRLRQLSEQLDNLKVYIGGMVEKLVMKELYVNHLNEELLLFHDQELTKHASNEYTIKQDAIVKSLKSNLIHLRHDFSNLTTKLTYRNEEITSYMMKSSRLQNELSAAKTEYHELQNQFIDMHTKYEQLSNSLKDSELHIIELENNIINKDLELKQQVEVLQNKLIVCMSDYIEKSQLSQSQIDTLQTKSQDEKSHFLEKEMILSAKILQLNEQLENQRIAKEQEEQQYVLVIKDIKHQLQDKDIELKSCKEQSEIMQSQLLSCLDGYEEVRSEVILKLKTQVLNTSDTLPTHAMHSQLSLSKLPTCSISSDVSYSNIFPQDITTSSSPPSLYKKKQQQHKKKHHR